jgi:cytoplasmic tRNA 2-thiolation protein 1
VLRGDLPRLHRCTSIVTESTSSPISRSKPLKYAYEKEIVLYAYHRKLDYFSTECIYSPEAFRGSARSLIKSLERVRPSAILDIVRSGEAFAAMVPGEIRGAMCAGEKGAMAKQLGGTDEEETGCGKGSASDSIQGGGEMMQFEKQLVANGKAEHLETEVTMPMMKVPSRRTNGQIKKEPTPAKSRKQQQLGSCRRCGYMSSQEFCKACVILSDLDKNRPKIEVELDDDEEDASSSVRRKLEALELRKSLAAA